MSWFVLAINPDPWAIGPVGVGKRNGKMYPYVGPNKQLVAYKQAVVEELEAQGASMLPPGEYELSFWFWRRLDGTARNKKHVADATNMQKATEDATQGVLIDNDRGVVLVRSRIVEQSADTEPCVVIHATHAQPFNVAAELPSDVLDKIATAQLVGLAQQSSDNTWPPA